MGRLANAIATYLETCEEESFDFSEVPSIDEVADIMRKGIEEVKADKNHKRIDVLKWWDDGADFRKLGIE